MGFASELAEEMQNERVAEFGEGVFAFPSKFFNQHVTVTAPNGVSVQRSPGYCATQYGAAQVSIALNTQRGLPASIVLAEAMGWPNATSWGFTDSQLVPWLQFKKSTDPEAGPFTGPKVNAAILLTYFNHGYPAKYALNSCQLEVWDAFVQAGLMNDFDRGAIMAQPEDL